MSNDLLGRITQTFEKRLKKLNIKATSYEDVNDYAVALGEILTTVFNIHITENPGEIIEQILNDRLKENHRLITDFGRMVQDILNKQAKIGLVAQIPEVNQNRIDGLISRLIEGDFEDNKWLLGSPIVNFSQAVVDDMVRKNAEFHFHSGMSPKIVRKETGKCCKWCKNLAGSYRYPGVPKDVYRRHQNCNCVVEYYPGKGKKQNVWSKKWKDIEKDDKIKERIKLSKPVDYKLANEDIADKLQVQSDEWVHKLSYDEQQAIHDYTDTFYTRINKYLRGLDVSEYFDEYYTKDDLAKSIKNLDSALSKFRLEENITFYRGVSYEELDFLKKSNEIKNFVSLTTDKDKIAKFFIEDYGGGEIIKFNLKKGTKGAYVGTNSANPGEREFILSRNSKYSIKNVKDQWEVTIIEQ